MRWWDRKPTCVLEARVQELKEKGKGKSVRVSVVPISCGQGFNPLGDTSHMYSQDRCWRGSASGRVEALGVDCVCWTVWIWWPGISDPQECGAVVDTGAQCALMPIGICGVRKSLHFCGDRGDSQELTVLEAEVSLSGKDWQKHPIVTGPDALCILGIDYLRYRYFKDPKGH